METGWYLIHMLDGSDMYSFKLLVPKTTRLKCNFYDYVEVMVSLMTNRRMLWTLLQRPSLRNQLETSWMFK